MATKKEKRDEIVTIATVAAREAARVATHETLTAIGIDMNDPIRVQKNFAHLDRWTRNVEKMQSKGMLTAVGILVTGALGVFLVGVQQVLSGIAHIVK